MTDETSLLLNFGKPVDDANFIEDMKARLWDLLGWPRRRNVAFPGSQPVSFARSHLYGELLHDHYYVCEKSDGVRYLLYFTAPFDKHTAYLIDRNFKVREVENFAIPNRDHRSLHTDTLLDGELVVISKKEGEDSSDKDQKKQDAEVRFEFLIFDCLMVNGQSVVNKDLQSRLTHAQNDIAGPLKSIKDPMITLTLKKMWKPYSIAQILEIEIPKQIHGNDGLIFTPVDDPYMPGTCDRILKWKPSDLNTVDFQLRIDHDTRDLEKKYDLCVVGRNQIVEHFAYHQPDPSLDELDGKILECSPIINQEIGELRWKYIRVRKDKTSANYFAVVTKILDSIRDNVTAKELIAAIPSIKKEWDKRESLKRQPPQKRVK